MYYVKDIFYTIQGEGHNVGTPSLFIRFSGCNLWSGKDTDRSRDARRNSVECPKWCDTDFFNGRKVDLSCIASMSDVAPPTVKLIVLTGGEPLLQADEGLCAFLKSKFTKAEIAVETNGTVKPKARFDWVCVSPKVPEEELAVREGHELKVVYPSYDPHSYTKGKRTNFTHKYVSPVYPYGMRDTSLLLKENIKKCISFVKGNPDWKLSLQTHKGIGIE